MIDLLKREIKIDRKVIITFLIINFLIIGLYYTYSIFVMHQLKENIYLVTVRNNMVLMSSNNLTNDSITVAANTQQDVTINLNNTATTTMYYRIMHEGVPTGVSVYEKNNDGTSSGSIAVSGTKSSVITINNTTGTAVTIKFYIEESTEQYFDKMQGGSCVNQTPNFDHSGANAPEFPSNMIPVYYEPASSTTTEGVWKKADVNNANSSAIWYDYDNFRWANAVTITDKVAYAEVVTTGQTVSVTSPTDIDYTFTSGGKNINSANSQMILTISSATGGTFTMDYSVSSESCCDKLTVLLDGTAVSGINGIGGTQSGTYTLNMSAGVEYTITATYKKDGSVNTGDDQAILSNLTYPADTILEYSSTGTHPWTVSGFSSYATSYTLDMSSGTFVLGNIAFGDVSSDYVDKYVCQDITKSSCTTMYKVKTVNGSTITSVDVYSTTSSSLLDAYNNAAVGTTITSSDINAFFVWIPKYKYNIVSGDGNISYERLINVNFLGRNDISEEGTVSCVESISNSADKHLYSEICTDSIYGTVQNNLSTYTHPAFNDDDKGFWIGKFANKNSQNYTIKAGISTSSSSTAATSSYVRQMIAVGNQYGFKQNANATYNATTWNYTDGVTNIDPHPITSMEWGAVAILTNSLYGKSGNPMYSTETKKDFTRIYNNPGTTTGYSTNYTTSSTSLSSTTSSTYYYNLTNVTHTTSGVTYPIGYSGAGASTTGTIYGVYDMSGGGYTTVMGVVMKEDGTSPYSMDSKYYTKYSYIPYSGPITDTTISAYLETFRLGDGIKEHVRTFTEKGMWQDGSLTLTNTGLMRRGGYTTTGSLFSTEIINSTTLYETFTVLKYYSE